MEKKYDNSLIIRVKKIRDGLGKQPMASLWTMDPTLKGSDLPKYRRILSGKVFPGDLPHVDKLEKVKAKLIAARK